MSDEQYIDAIKQASALADRLDAALRRIEALELEVARLKGPKTYKTEGSYAQAIEKKIETIAGTLRIVADASVPQGMCAIGERYPFIQHHDLTGEPLTLSCGCVGQCGGHETAQLEHGKIVYYAPHSRSQVDMRADEYGANGTPLPDEGT